MGRGLVAVLQADVFQILLRRGLRCVKDVVERQRGLRDGAGIDVGNEARNQGLFPR